MRTPCTPARRSARARQLARRAAVLLASGLVVAGAAGCGSEDRRTGPRSNSGATTVDAATEQSDHFTAQQVAEHFRAVTGDTLDIEPHEVTWDTLTLAGATGDELYRLQDRYGIFTIAVLHSTDSAEVFKTDDGRPLPPDADGIHWSQDDDGGWRASKFYGANVVLSWSADQRATDDTFDRMDTILSALGQPAAAVRAELPPAEQPCEARGITLAGRSEGTCRDGSVTLTVVNRGHRLRLPGYTVKVLLTKSGD